MQYIVHVVDSEYLTFLVEAPDPIEAGRKVLRNDATADVVIASLKTKRVREIQSTIAKQ